MGRHQNGHAGIIDRPEHLHDLLGNFRVKITSGFIRDQNPGLVQHCTGGATGA